MKVVKVVKGIKVKVAQKICPYCGHHLSKNEMAAMECFDCGHILILKDGVLRLPNYKDE